MQFKDTNHLIRAIGDRCFRVKWVFHIKEICIEDYQDLFRFYLDEYPEQKELRKNWFEKLNNQRLIAKIIYSCFYSVKDFLNAFKKKEIKDTYFENRWLRRN